MSKTYPSCGVNSYALNQECKSGSMKKSEIIKKYFLGKFESMIK